MPQLMVDRLSFHLDGMSESSARQLSSLVAQGLAGAELGNGGDIESLRINVTPAPGSSMQSLSDQIVAELMSQLKRTL